LNAFKCVLFQLSELSAKNQKKRKKTFTQTKPTKKNKNKKYYIVQKKVICPGEPTERAIFLGVMK
jgi:hypothetical protein